MVGRGEWVRVRLRAQYVHGWQRYFAVACVGSAGRMAQVLSQISSVRDPLPAVTPLIANRWKPLDGGIVHVAVVSCQNTMLFAAQAMCQPAHTPSGHLLVAAPLLAYCAATHLNSLNVSRPRPRLSIP